MSQGFRRWVVRCASVVNEAMPASMVVTFGAAGAAGAAWHGDQLTGPFGQTPRGPAIPPCEARSLGMGPVAGSRE